VLTVVGALAFGARADETCNSPYMAQPIKGQEQFVHVRTLGVEGLGDGDRAPAGEARLRTRACPMPCIRE
jgi:hypothetical protein